MTARLCLIGNSHLVALQAALAAEPERWPLDCRFVPFRGDAVADIAVTDGILRPTSEAARAQMRQRTGAEAVDLRGYDAIAVVGLGLKAQHAQSLWKEARWPGLPSLDAEEDLAALRPALISRRAAEAALTGALSAVTGFDVAARIAGAVACPVHVIGQPRLHAGARHHPMGQFFGLSRAIRAGDAAAISDLFEAASAAAAGACGVTVLPQPRRTIVDHILTDPPYMAGTARVRRKDGVTEIPDFKHPNAAYGALMLDLLANAVNGPVAA
jgi:hypothetical protein